MRILLVSTLLALGVACASDQGVVSMCGTPVNGFDITQASVLEDAQGYPNMHDAVILDVDPQLAQDGSIWRVRSVEIMPMIGQSQFSSFRDGQTVTVEVWDGTNPHATPWRVSQVFHKDDLDWTDTQLTNPTTAFEFNQKQAWWTFDFGDTIPTSGMTGPQYIVGVNWDSSALPALGYSNFNRSCAENWTDYADGFGWVLNSDNGSGSQCSWPMLRVHLEKITASSHCESGSVAIQ